MAPRSMTWQEMTDFVLEEAGLKPIARWSVNPQEASEFILERAGIPPHQHGSATRRRRSARRANNSEHSSLAARASAKYPKRARTQDAGESQAWWLACMLLRLVASMLAYSRSMVCVLGVWLFWLFSANAESDESADDISRSREAQAASSGAVPHDSDHSTCHACARIARIGVGAGALETLLEAHMHEVERIVAGHCSLATSCTLTGELREALEVVQQLSNREPHEPNTLAAPSAGF